MLTRGFLLHTREGGGGRLAHRLALIITEGGGGEREDRGGWITSRRGQGEIVRETERERDKASERQAER